MPLSAHESELMHLVPSLLPDTVDAAVNRASDVVVKLHLAFYTGGTLLRYSCAERTYLKRRCSLPAGIFEQVCIRSVTSTTILC